MADDKFCRYCGAQLPKDSNFCLKCGATLTSTHATERQIEGFPQSRQNEPPTRATYSSSYYPQKQTSLGGLGASFWLGFVGGIFGILGGVLAFLAGSLYSSYYTSDSGLYWLGAGAIIFSILGIVGGAFERRKKVGGTLMIISAIGILISISLFGVLSCILFLVGGILIFARNRRP